MANKILPLLLSISIFGCSMRNPPTNNYFSYAAIQKTSAPWDGQAIHVFLAREPLEVGKPKAPHMLVAIYKSAEKISKGRYFVDGSDRRLGDCFWVDGKGSKNTPHPRATLSFGEVKEGTPVEGTYDIHLPDGTRATGKIQAEWWPNAGPGG